MVWIIVDDSSDSKLGVRVELSELFQACWETRYEALRSGAMRRGRLFCGSRRRVGYYPLQKDRQSVLRKFEKVFLRRRELGFKKGVA